METLYSKWLKQQSEIDWKSVFGTLHLTTVLKNTVI